MSDKSKNVFSKGFILVDKLKGESSFDVVRRWRREIGVRKMGHSGTLDPLATGLMLLAFSEATKFLQYLISCDKSYEVLLEFGKYSDSYDADGEIFNVDGWENFNFSDKKFMNKILDHISDQFLGSISQMPPKYSALKVGGKRACDVLRAGGDVKLKARNVMIYDFKFLNKRGGLYKFSIHCGSGTYIRSLVHDLGQVLGCGAYVKELRRTQLGAFDFDNIEVDKIISIEDFCKKSFNCVDLSVTQFEALQNGCSLEDSKLSKKIEQVSAPCVAFYDDGVVGILKSVDDFAKFAKRVW